MCRYVTMDERWLHHFTLEPNRLSAERTARDKPTRKREIMQRSATKVMASVFWYVRGVKFIGYLKKGKNINKDFCIVLLKCLKNEIVEKEPHLETKKMLVSSRQCTVSQVNENDSKIT